MCKVTGPGVELPSLVGILTPGLQQAEHAVGQETRSGVDEDGWLIR